jgi:hypothetical protein
VTFYPAVPILIGGNLSFNHGCAAEQKLEQPSVELEIKLSAIFCTQQKLLDSKELLLFFVVSGLSAVPNAAIGPERI